MSAPVRDPGAAGARVDGAAAQGSTPARLRDLGALAVECALAAGAAEAEACVESTRSFSVGVSGGAIETLKQNVTRGLGLRVLVGDAVGFVTTTDLTEGTLDDLAHRAVALARFLTPDPCNAFVTPAEAEGADGATLPEDLALFDPAVRELPAEKKIEWALELERLALAFDPRITRTDGAHVSTHDGASAIVNSNGIARAWDSTAVTAYVVPLADDRDGRQQTGCYGVSKRWLRDLPEPRAIAAEAARRAVSRIGARSVPSARVPVVLHPDIAANWISEMHKAFSGEALLKESSWLTGKLEQLIAAPLVTLVDDGRLRAGIGTEPWDGEGVATRKNRLIDRGRLATFVYDVYHARRAGRRSSGNAVRGYSSQPSIGFTNLYIEAGAQSPEQILKQVDRGFFMDDQGSFGFNSVTGDYSYQAQGFWIENGEKAFPVEGVTVASNSLEMLKNVVAVGNDLRFDHSVASSTLLISEMTVSGRAA
ncbi:MAG: TldD/PmbA family protein [Candidatus Eisenbacteria bacterium]|nr:TldD/PmbA family protein [Candidatus Eisenbacteria bacterium]